MIRSEWICLDLLHDDVNSIGEVLQTFVRYKARQCWSFALMVESAGIALAGRGCACMRNPFARRDACVTKPRAHPAKSLASLALAVRSGATHALRIPALTVPDADSIAANCNIKVKRHPMKLDGVLL